LHQASSKYGLRLLEANPFIKRTLLRESMEVAGCKHHHPCRNDTVSHNVAPTLQVVFHCFGEPIHKGLSCDKLGRLVNVDAMHAVSPDSECFAQVVRHTQIKGSATSTRNNSDLTPLVPRLIQSTACPLAQPSLQISMRT